MPDPYLVGIAGPSGSGKTEIARRLVKRHQGSHLSLDDYYRDLAHLPLAERAAANFDDPSMVDWALLERHVAALGRGEEIPKPVYDFTTHTRNTGVEAFRAGPLLVVEGIFALYHETVRRLFHTSVFVAAPDEVC